MKKILTVDDSATVRSMIYAVLIEAGFTVIQAEDGQQALAIAVKDKFDLVISDVTMPTMDGIELVKNLRGLPNYQFIPILLLTTETSIELKQAAKKAGATGWMSKPFEPVTLLKTLKLVLENNQ